MQNITKYKRPNKARWASWQRISILLIALALVSGGIVMALDILDLGDIPYIEYEASDSTTYYVPDDDINEYNEEIYKYDISHEEEDPYPYTQYSDDIDDYYDYYAEIGDTPYVTDEYGHIDEENPPHYYEDVIEVFILTSSPFVSFHEMDLEGVETVRGRNNSPYSLEHYKTLPASVESISQITIPRREGYTLVDWVALELDDYGNTSPADSIIIQNTSWNSEYYYSADVTLADHGDVRVFAYFMPTYEPIMPLNGNPPFLITFNANGGSSGYGQTERWTQTVGFGNTGILGTGNMPTPPTMGGAQFMHWTFDQEGLNIANVFTGAQGVSGNTTVFAQWGYQVQFNGNGMNLPAAQQSRIIRIGGHSANTTPTWVPTNQQAWPPDPNRNGWTFSGWYTVQAQTGGQRYEAGTTIPHGVLLFARWVLNPVITINFNTMGGTPSGSHTLSRQAIQGMNLNTSTNTHGLNAGVPSATDVPLVNHPAGYNLTGWWATSAGPAGGGTHFSPNNSTWPTQATGGAGTGQSLSSMTINNPFTLYAHYARRITFVINHSGGASLQPSGAWGGVGANRGAMVDIPVTSLAPVNATVQGHGAWMNRNGTVHLQGVLPILPAMPGYTFVGWFSTSAQTGGTQFHVDTQINTFPWQNPNQRTLWARWIPNPPVTITFDANGGQFGTSQTTQQRSITQHANGAMQNNWTPNMSVSFPTLPGHVFMGWHYTPDGPPTPVRGTPPSDADLRVYARWHESISITFLTTGTASGNPQVFNMPRGFSPFEWSSLFYDNPEDLENGWANLSFQPLVSNSPGVHPSIWTSAGSPPSPNQTLHLGWNSEPDQSGIWWNLTGWNQRFYEDTLFHNFWMTSITFDRNHTFIIPTAVDNSLTRMSINIPVGYSLSNRHEHDLYMFTNFANPRDRRVWAAWPDFYTWRPSGNSVPTFPHQLPLPEWGLMGWNTARDGSGQWFDINLPRGMNQGRTYFAVWGQTVTFWSGFAPSDVITAPNRDRLVNFPNTIESDPRGMVTVPIWPGPVGEVPVFHSWNTQPDRTGTRFDGDTIVPGPQTLFATWNANVTFDPNATGATGGGVVTDVILGRAVGGGIDATQAARPNWVFREWNRTQDGSGASFPLLGQAGHVYYMTRVYAQWDGRVTFDPNGGTMAPNTPLVHRISESDTIQNSRYEDNSPWDWVTWPVWPGGMPANPTRSQGEYFAGWWWQDDNDNWHEFTGTTPMTMGDVTVTARWRTNTLSFIKTNASLYETPRVIDQRDGAVFVLERYDVANNQWVYVETSQPSGHSGISGQVTFDRALTSDTRYRIRETIAPASYNLPPGHWEFEMASNGGGIIGGASGIAFHENTNFTGSRGDIFDFVYITDEGWHVGNVQTREWPIHKTDWNLYTALPHNYLPGAEFKLFVYTGEGAPGDVLITESIFGQDLPWSLVETQTSSGLSSTPMIFPMMPGRVYQLIETIPPEGHQLPWGQWQIRVVADESRPQGYRLEVEAIGSISQPVLLGNYTDPQNPVYRVGNREDIVLPLAGGSGTSNIMLGGTVLIVMALLLLGYKMFKQKQSI